MKAESLATEMVNDQETQVGFWKLLYITRGRLWVGVASVLGFLVVWQLVAFAGLVDPMFTASPSQILARGREWFGTGEIYPHLADTATQFFFGYVGGVLLGV
ncbi:MAG: hypothetical protein Q8P59_11605, partial [Dehalococcoidia bacterium]|nr:hypothetical protein [Dehalococcoidia bacterium]